MLVLHRCLIATLLLAALVGCGDDDNGSSRPQPADAGVDSDATADAAPDTVEDATPDADEVDLTGCNPLAPEIDCLLPFPSDFFLVPDPSTASGSRLELTENATLRAVDGRSGDMTALHPADGFSVHPTLLALFPGGVDVADLVYHADAEQSLAPGSTTVLLDTETGEPVLHFAEMDVRAPSDSERVLFIRPAVRLVNQRRYVVAIRGLHDPSGATIEAPQPFAAMRDGTSGLEGAAAELAARYETDVFPVLEQYGVDRSSLQLAWDFTTRSETDATSDMLQVRSQTLAAMADAVPAPVIATVERNDELGMVHVQGTFEAPLFLHGDAELIWELCRDESGTVTRCGTLEVPFAAAIPTSIWDDPASRPVRVVHYGHGFFGDRIEVLEDLVATFAKATGSVVVCVDWYGMATEDLPEVGANLIDVPEQGLRFVDRVHQGMANQLVLTEVIRHTLPDVLKADDGGAVYDPDDVYYYGLSNGHILGGTFLALSDIETAAVGAGGAAYTLIMFRSLNFMALSYVLAALYGPSLNQQKWASLAQLTLDRIDPITYAPYVLERPLEGGATDRRLLVQTGVGDSAVPSVAAHLHARALAIPLLTPAVRSITGLEEVPYPAESGLVETDFQVTDPIPGELADFGIRNDVHDTVRITDPTLRQLDAFFTPERTIVHTCDGPCDPE